MATIRQVAEIANVSIATVSRVINNSTGVTEEAREKVLSAINKCGYVPAVGRRTTSFLALVYAGPTSLGSPYDSAILEGMAQAMESTNLDLMILNPRRDKAADESFTQFFLRKGVRGVILRSTVEGRPVCKEIGAEKFPAIVVGDHFQDENLSFAYADSTKSSKQAIEHLIGLGHSRVAFASNDIEDGDHQDRFSAYCEVLKNAGIDLDPSIIFHVPARRPDGAQLLRNIMGVPHPPTAVYITDPPVAVGLINEARKMSVNIPGDLSVVGFDDQDVRSCVFPIMTAVCQDACQLGRDAFLALSKCVENGNGAKPLDCISSTWLEICDSTGQPAPEPVRVLPNGSRIPLLS